MKKTLSQSEKNKRLTDKYKAMNIEPVTVSAYVDDHPAIKAMALKSREARKAMEEIG